MTATWFGAAPQILLLVVVLGLPGLVTALCLRFRWWDALGLSVPLSLGVLAVADEVAIHSHTRWGLPVIAATTVVVALVCWGLARWVRRSSVASDGDDAGVSVEGPRWGRREHLIAAVVTLGAAVLGAFAVARGIGAPHSINQSWDSAFHVNAINAVAHHHSASPGTVNKGGDPTASGFYPPLFAAVAAIPVMYAGVNPIVAANVALVTIAFLWPVTVSIAVRRIARPSVFGYAVAMWGAVVLALFPALLEMIGRWPNVLSMLTIAPALVMMLRILGLDRSGAASEDPPDRLSWWPSLVALVLFLPGIVFAQPASAFFLFYFGVPMVIWLVWRVLIDQNAGTGRKVVWGSAVLAAAMLATIAVIWLSYRIHSIAVTGRFSAPWPHWSLLHAVGQVVMLDTPRSSANVAFGVLALIGGCFALRHPRGRFLATCYGIVALLFVLATSVQTHLSHYLTGYWYNDWPRLAGMLPIVALPLCALGADGLWEVLRAGVARLAAHRGSVSPRSGVLVATASAVAICLAVLALQLGLGTSQPSHTINANYSGRTPGAQIVLAGEVDMLRRLGRTQFPGGWNVPAGEAIAGSPITGEAFAGVLSGRPVIYTSLHNPLKGTLRALVAASFYKFRQDPAVCQAVKQLRIGIVLAAQHYRAPVSPQYRRDFAGFSNFDQLVQSGALTPIDQGGQTYAYLVNSCRS